MSAGATLTGTVLVLGLPLCPELKLLALCLWLSRGVLELRAQKLGTSRIDRIRMYSSGRVEGLRRTRAERPLTVLAGSVLLRRAGWLRLRHDDGLEHGELLFGNPRRDQQWRRLHLIWRQQAAVFGGPEGS